MEEVGEQIGAKEGRRRFLQDRIKGIREQLARCRKDREAITEERNQVENQLSTINKEVGTLLLHCCSLDRACTVHT